MDRHTSTTSPATSPSTMGPSTLDLFILTFNCAKTFINVPVFASHLQDALTRNATGLPDLVVFSLQEFAPLSYSFIGGYFLSPYLARFEEALNLAAAQVTATLPSTSGDAESDSLLANGQSNGDATSGSRNGGRPKPYHLIKSHNAGMTAIMLFARDPEAVHRAQVAEVGFGAADMGNKGAAGVRVAYAVGEGQTSEVTFVATHFAAMEWNLRRRNKNWKSIVSDLLFENPKKVIEGLEGLGSGLKGRLLDSAASPPLGPDDEDEDAQPLLSPEQEAALLQHNDKLRDISVFKPSSHLFVAGDLNYRIGAKTPPPLAAFPSLDEASPDYWPAFLDRDQLTQEREAGRTLHGLSEAPIAFPPTYKLDIQSSPDGAVNEAAARADSRVVPFAYAPHRWPSWCDRVLFLETPRAEARKVDVAAYQPLPVVRTSDHQAVFLRARVPVLQQQEGGAAADADANNEDDPRVRLPVPVDVDAWERRAAARRREVLVGWSMFLWSTREGAVVIATLMLVSVGGWWVWQGV